MLKVVRAQGQGIVSDLGRWGYQHEGVPIGGVLDTFSFSLANLALGNPANAACLELMGQFDFVCAKPCLVLFANRGAHALLNNKPVLCGQVLGLQEGDVLRTQPPGLGFWNVLCVQGGVDVPEMTGSRSTCLVAGFGGLQGRALQVGDELHFAQKFTTSIRHGVRLAMPLARTEHSACLVLHVLPGPEFFELSENSQHLFTRQHFSLGTQSSRMGYRLEALESPLSLKHVVSLRSHAVHPGLVQLPPSGQPVVLLCEAQVTGGYPRLGSVLSCDLWKLSQLGGGESVSWVLVNEQQAQRLQARHELDRKRYQQAIEYNKATTHVD